MVVIAWRWTVEPRASELDLLGGRNQAARIQVAAVAPRSEAAAARRRVSRVSGFSHRESLGSVRPQGSQAWLCLAASRPGRSSGWDLLGPPYGGASPWRRAGGPPGTARQAGAGLAFTACPWLSRVLSTFCFEPGNVSWLGILITVRAVFHSLASWACPKLQLAMPNIAYAIL